MSRKILTLVMALAFVVGLSGMALAINMADVNQSGTENYAYIDQIGGNLGNNTIDIDQVAGTTNDAEVYQWGNGNVLVGADSNGTINLSNAATQISAASYNDLYCVQSGDGNEAGLYQNASSFNDASITQYNGGNSLVAWQNAPGGSNELTSLQNGGMKAVVIQNANSGNNVASISQQ